MANFLSEDQTFSVNVAEELLSLSPDDGAIIEIHGRTTIGDGGHLKVQYSSSSTATPDGRRIFNGAGGTTLTATDGTGRYSQVDRTNFSETVTAASPILAAGDVSNLDSSSNAITATLGDGDYVGQMALVVMTDATNSSTVSVTNHETSDPEVFTFDAVDEYLLLLWTGTEWATIKATATV